MDYIYGSHIAGQFDVQVDGNNHWEDTMICEIDVYPVSLTNEGYHSTDTVSDPLASRRVPTGEYSDDMWYGATDAVEASTADLPETLPENVRAAFKEALVEAVAAQKLFTGTFRYGLGTTVFIPEHRFPGEVEAHTVNGGYIVNMANSGELAEFAPDELEDYDDDLWNRA